MCLDASSSVLGGAALEPDQLTTASNRPFTIHLSPSSSSSTHPQIKPVCISAHYSFSFLFTVSSARSMPGRERSESTSSARAFKRAASGLSPDARRRPRSSSRENADPKKVSRKSKRTEAKRTAKVASAAEVAEMFTDHHSHQSHGSTHGQHTHGTDPRRNALYAAFARKREQGTLHHLSVLSHSLSFMLANMTLMISSSLLRHPSLSPTHATHSPRPFRLSPRHYSAAPPCAPQCTRPCV